MVGSDDETLTAWVAGYEQAWRSPGTDLLAELFTDDAEYLATPYHEPVVGLAAIRAFWDEHGQKIKDGLTSIGWVIIDPVIAAFIAVYEVVRDEVIPRFGDLVAWIIENKPKPYNKGRKSTARSKLRVSAAGSRTGVPSVCRTRNPSAFLPGVAPASRNELNALYNSVGWTGLAWSAFAASSNPFARNSSARRT